MRNKIITWDPALTVPSELFLSEAMPVRIQPLNNRGMAYGH